MVLTIGVLTALLFVLEGFKLTESFDTFKDKGYKMCSEWEYMNTSVLAFAETVVYYIWYIMMFVAWSVFSADVFLLCVIVMMLLSELKYSVLQDVFKLSHGPSQIIDTVLSVILLTFAFASVITLT
jgi:hypothetical protein